MGAGKTRELHGGRGVSLAKVEVWVFKWLLSPGVGRGRCLAARTGMDWFCT